MRQIGKTQERGDAPMKRCNGCGKDHRIGVMVFLLIDGSLKGARVCQSCASGGVLLVAPKLAPVVKQAAPRPEGLDRAIRMLRTYAKAAEANGAQARASGFEGAIECIRRECGL